MNESDDYNFSVTENSNLSSLFEKDSSLDLGNSSLSYKAPKQPSNAENKDTKPSPTKFYYKYIILHEIIADKEQKLGQYIMGLMNSEGSNAELLIYQNKKNILIREHIGKFLVTKSRKKFSLILLASRRKWMLEFLNQSDYTEFADEFSKNGIEIISTFNNDQTQKNVLKQNDLYNFQPDFQGSESNSSILDKTPTNDTMIDMYDTDKSKDSDSKREKNEILTRLAKIGLPLLPSFHKETEDILENPYTDEGKKGFICDKSISTSRTRNDYTSENNQHIMNNKKTVASVLTTNTFDPYEHYLDQATNQIQLNNVLSTDPFNSIIAENRISNNELKQYISLMNCKLDSIKKYEELNENKTLRQLKSKIRAMEMKCENLEDELGRYRSKCSKLDKMNEELTFQIRKIEENTFTEKKETSSQTHSVDERMELENNNYKYQLIKLLKSLHCLPLNSDEFDITQLKCLKDDIVDEELQSHLDKCMEFLQEKPQFNKLGNVVEMKESYIKSTRQIMIKLFLVVRSFLAHDSMLPRLAEQVRITTEELVQSFDQLIQSK